MPVQQDIVVQTPDAITQLQRLGAIEGNDYVLEPGYYAMIPKDDEYFIHARAMLPLKDFKDGVGFGLWVNVAKDDYELYLRTEHDVNLYQKFSCTGTLANTWPGFPGTFGDVVKIRTVHLKEKVYITEYLSEPKDVMMRRSLLAQVDDQETKEYVRDLAMSYLVDMQTFADAPHFDSSNTAS